MQQKPVDCVDNRVSSVFREVTTDIPCSAETLSSRVTSCMECIKILVLRAVTVHTQC